MYVPRPEPYPNYYTAARVREGYEYAEQRLRTENRRVSPLTESYLRIYQGKCAAYLLADETNMSKKKRYKMRTEIRNCENSLNDRPWLKEAPPEHQTKGQRDLLRVRKLQMFARYGDYLAQLCRQLQVTKPTPTNAQEESRSAQFRWSELAPTITHQYHTREEHRADLIKYPQAYTESYPELEAFEKAVGTASLSFDECLRAINAYSTRNQTVHNDLEDLI